MWKHYFFGEIFHVRVKLLNLITISHYVCIMHTYEIPHVIRLYSLKSRIEPIVWVPHRRRFDRRCRSRIKSYDTIFYYNTSSATSYFCSFMFRRRAKKYRSLIRFNRSSYDMTATSNDVPNSAMAPSNILHAYELSTSSTPCLTLRVTHERV